VTDMKRSVFAPNIIKSLLLSLALHTCFFGAIVLLSRLELPKHDQREYLVVELEGTISDKQSEEKTLSDTQKKQEAQKSQTNPTLPKPKTQEAVKQQKKDEVSEANDGYKPLQKQTQAHEEQKTTPQPQNKELEAKTSQAEKTASDQNAKQQTIEREKVDMSQFRKYLAKVNAKIQSHVVYPKEAKEKVRSGNPALAFTINIDGSVNRSSIKIAKSSGYDLLDEYAINAVMKSAPFEKPYKPLNVSVEVYFSAK